MKRKPPLPRSFDLPGGYHVKVLRVATGEHGLSASCDGEWYAKGDGGKILLRRNLPRAKALQILMHELDHALTDFKLWFVQKYE